MTRSEVLDNFYDQLMCDERILNVRERELLSNLLQRAHTHAGGDRAALTKTIAHAVGETVAQRAYETLGENITRRLLEQQKPSYEAAVSGVLPSVPDASQGSGFRRPVISGPPGGPGPHPPGPPSAQIRHAQSSASAVLDLPKTLPADCVILDEFLAPAELDSLLRYTLDQESAFQISEVIRPGTGGGIIDYDHRRSRVLMDLGEYRRPIVDRIHACLPRVLTRLGRQTFAVSSVEAQITASNDGDYFHGHADNAQDNSDREITFVYFFHREPKQFRGGELRIYDCRRENNGYSATESYRSIMPQPNQIVFFASALIHEITPVECASKSFADSRFTVNGWLHR